MEEYLTLEQVSEYLQVPKTTLYKYTSKNTHKTRLRGARIGRGFRYRKSEVDRWFEEIMDQGITSDVD